MCVKNYAFMQHCERASKQKDNNKVAFIRLFQFNASGCSFLLLRFVISLVDCVVAFVSRLCEERRKKLNSKVSNINNLLSNFINIRLKVTTGNMFFVLL